jgi:hypothetical protein
MGMGDGLDLKWIGDHHRFTCGDKTRDTAMQFPVASITTSSVFLNCLPNPSRAVQVMSTRPSCRVTPFSQITTSPKGAVDVYADYASHARLPCQ